jgi:hypothetical protein
MNNDCLGRSVCYLHSFQKNRIRESMGVFLDQIERKKVLAPKMIFRKQKTESNFCDIRVVFQVSKTVTETRWKEREKLESHKQTVFDLFLKIWFSKKEWVLKHSFQLLVPTPAPRLVVFGFLSRSKLFLIFLGQVVVLVLKTNLRFTQNFGL